MEKNMENEVEATNYADDVGCQGVLQASYPRMDSQMEQSMENEMETGVCAGVILLFLSKSDTGRESQSESYSTRLLKVLAV